MARNLASRVCIKGTLVAQTPLHIGGLGGNADTDLALAQDGAGRFYLSGTGLAGALQSWMRRRAGDENAVNQIWGFQNPKDDTGQASFILVEDAPLGDDAPFEIRDGVGIDRITGAAATGKKYDRAVLPRGTKIPLHMVWERPVEKEPAAAETLVKDMLCALERGDIRLGASKSRGLGRVLLTGLKIGVQELNTFKGMLATLGDDHKNTGGLDLLQPNSSVKLNNLPRLDITINWTPCGPLMVKAAQDGIIVDSLPLVSGLDNSLVSPVLPGSGVKGALRAQAERIVRTCCPSLSCPENDLLRQVQVPLVTALFGAAGEKDDKDDDDQPGPPRLGLSALTVDDCYSNTQFTADQWQKVARAENLTGLQDALGHGQTPTHNKTPHWRQAVHVAIDRWTGGAAEGLLYSVLEPRGQEWEPLRLSVDLGRLPDNEQAPALALLYLTLRDLARGEITLGFGGNHGMGSIKIDSVKVTPDDLPTNLEGYNMSANSGLLKLTDPTVQATLQTEWKAWIAVEEKKADEEATRKKAAQDAKQGAMS